MWFAGWKLVSNGGQCPPYQAMLPTACDWAWCSRA